MPEKKQGKLLCVDDLRHAEYYHMQNTFDDLYARSLANETFTDLMDIILSRENILLAYRNIKSNHGSRTPGTDKLDIRDIGRLQPDEVIGKVRYIVAGTPHGYRPKPVRRKDIPKPNGTTRPLGIPCIWDRLIQQCIKQVMEPICEAKFSDNSYGFRPQRSVEHAIQSTYRLIQRSNLHHIVEFDIKGFFDNVNHLTFGIDADNIRSAKPRLERIETDILNNFKRLGVSAEVLNGQERLRVLHDILRMDTPESFAFRWEDLPRSGLSTKDYISPSSFLFNRAKDFRMGKKFASVSFLQILAPELSDRILKDFLDIESSIVVNIHVQSVDQTKAIKTIKRTITDLDKSKIEEQKKAVRAGYDMDIIPSDLATYGAEAKKLLSDLQSRNQRMFLVTFLILNTADTKRQLDNNVFQTNSIAQKYNCSITALDYQQEEGMVSSLPLGLNQIEIQRGLTSSGVGIFVPFTTQELYQDSPEALYYGINALSNNIIMRMPTYSNSAEYADNRISLFSAQWGKCAVTGDEFSHIGEIHCHHKLPRHLGGDDSYGNLVLIKDAVHKLIHASNTETIHKYMDLLQLDSKRLAKVNNLRQLASMQPI